MLPPLVSNGMVIDGSTQPGYAGKPLIILDGSQIIPETYTSDTGFLVYSSSNQVKDISFSGFVWNGLTFTYADATNNTVSGCWIGVDALGRTLRRMRSRESWSRAVRVITPSRATRFPGIHNTAFTLAERTRVET